MNQLSNQAENYAETEQELKEFQELAVENKLVLELIQQIHDVKIQALTNEVNF